MWYKRKILNFLKWRQKMRKIKNFFVKGLFLSIFSVNVFAHTLWINATDYSPEIYSGFGAETNLYFGFGHHFPVDDFLSQEKIEEFYYVCPRCGKHHNLKPNPGGFLATQVKFKEPGSYIVAAKLKPGFYTMFVEKGKVHQKIGHIKGPPFKKNSNINSSFSYYNI